MNFRLDFIAPNGHQVRCDANWSAVRPHEQYELRAELPSLCQGARRDVWPSGMARDMGQGLKVYVLRRKPLSAEDLVETLAPAAAHEVTTLAEQRAFASSFFGVAV